MTPPALPASSESAARAFEAERARLRGLAYRMTGSMWDADDIVAEASVRWLSADRVAIDSPAAFLTRVVTNLAIDLMTSARARRETYVGPWLPEPVLDADAAFGPADSAVQRESLSLAMLRVMERLAPRERAVFVLREVFAYPSDEVAEIVGTSAANVRQLLHRARAHLDGEPRFAAGDSAEFERVFAAFVAAATSGDVGALERVLHADVVAFSDGGGKVTAARRPVVGRGHVLAFMVGLAQKYGQPAEVRAVIANGAPALDLRVGPFRQVFAVSVRDGAVAEVMAVMNPDKTSHAFGEARPT